MNYPIEIIKNVLEHYENDYLGYDYKRFYENYTTKHRELIEIQLMTNKIEQKLAEVAEKRFITSYDRRLELKYNADNVYNKLKPLKNKSVKVIKPLFLDDEWTIPKKIK